MTEEYRDINDFPNYQVSNLGNVRNKWRGNILKHRPCEKKYGYICYLVQLYNDTRTLGFNKKIHKLVADAFLPNPDNKPIIDHIDRNTSNNNVSNLRWATYSENSLNSKTRIDNISGERNIFYSVQKQKWTYSHTKDKKTISCGFYDTKEEAIKAKETGDYNLMKTNTGEKYITYKANRNKYMFEKTTNGIRYRKAFATLEEAINERNKYLINHI
jgi:hypothetical protein